MKPLTKNSNSASAKQKSSSKIRRANQAGCMTENSLKLFLSLLVSLVAAISLARLIPYHSAQTEKLKELRAQVKETEYRVNNQRKQLQKNFDSSEIERLMEEHSPRVAKNRIRVILQEQD